MEPKKALEPFSAIPRHLSLEGLGKQSSDQIARSRSDETMAVKRSERVRKVMAELHSNVAQTVSPGKEFIAAPAQAMCVEPIDQSKENTQVQHPNIPFLPLLSASSAQSSVVPKPRLSFCEGIKFDAGRLHRLRTIVERNCDGRTLFFLSPAFEREVVKVAFNVLKHSRATYEDKIHQLCSIIAINRLDRIFGSLTHSQMDSIVALEEKDAEAIAQCQAQEIFAYAQRQPYSDIDLAYDEYLFRSYSQNQETQLHATFCAVKILLARPTAYMGLVGLASQLAKCKKTNFALDLVKRAIALYPDAKGPYLLAGNIHKRNYCFQMALEAYEHALSRDVTMFVQFSEIGQLYEINDLSVAGHNKAKEFQEGVLAKFQKPATKLRLEMLCVRGLLLQGKFNEAKLTNAQLFEKNDLEIFWWYEVQIALAQNRLDEAEDALNELESVTKCESIVHHATGLFWMAKGEADESLDYFMEIISNKQTLTFNCGIELCLPLSIPLYCCRMLSSMPNISKDTQVFMAMMLHEILSFNPDHPEALAIEKNMANIPLFPEKEP